MTCIYVQGIGDSSQGFVNGIIFCLLTPSVRHRLCLGFSKLYRCFCCSTKKHLQLMPSGEDDDNFETYTNSYKSTESVKERSMTNISADDFLNHFYGSRDEDSQTM